MEDARLQDWRRVYGLGKDQGAQDLSNGLKAHKLVLIATLTQVHMLTTDFAETPWQVR